MLAFQDYKLLQQSRDYGRIRARMVGSSNAKDWAVGAGVSPFTSDAIFRPAFSMEGLHVFRNTFAGLLQLLGRVHLLYKRLGAQCEMIHASPTLLHSENRS